MIRLLVVDDSALMRRLLGGVFAAEPGFTVAFARDGQEALAAIAAERPDVMTLDIEMPRLDGLTLLDRVMLERPLPVVMVSSLTAAGAAATLEALRLGAVDFLPKPQGAASLSVEEWGPRLVAKVRAAAGARLRPSHRLAERVRLRSGLPARPPAPAPGAVVPAPVPPAPAPPAPGVVLVGCSTGGPPALDALLAPLAADFPWAVVVAQHMPATFTGTLARRLDGLCALSVQEVTGPVRLEAGHVYVGRGDADVILGARPGGAVVLPAPADPARRWHPSVDRLVDSAMEHLPPARLLGVLMTGMGDDGAAAMTRLRAAGGRTLAEAESTAVVWGMPGELVRAGGAEAVAPLDELAATLSGWLS